MKDGFTRILIKRFALLRFQIDLKITRCFLIFQREPRYILLGDCQSCGSCCEAPEIQVRSWFFWLDSLRSCFLYWHKQVNGFHYLSHDRKNRTIAFTCTHFDPEKKRCDSYSSRPGMCRDYPKLLIYGSQPEFFTACGMRAVLKRAERFRDALDRIDMPNDRRRLLYRKLHINKSEDKMNTGGPK